MNVLKHFLGFQHSLAFKCFFREARLADCELNCDIHVNKNTGSFPNRKYHVFLLLSYKTDLIYYIDIKIIVLKGNKAL